MYRDIPAMCVSADSPTLNRLKLDEKLASDVFDNDSKEVFWEFLDQLTKSAFAACNETPPRVPTRAEIQEDIAKRQASRHNSSSSSSSSSSQTVSQSAVDAWKRVCSDCEVTCPHEGTLITSRLTSAIDSDIISLCQNKEIRGFKKLVATAFPEDDFSSVNELSDTTWEFVNKCMSLMTMNDAIR